jgi:hypothetical protein
MKHTRHLIICLVLVGAVGLAYVLVPQVRSLGWTGLFLLACPIMHLVMLKDGKHKH